MPRTLESTCLCAPSLLLCAPLLPCLLSVLRQLRPLRSGLRVPQLCGLGTGGYGNDKVKPLGVYPVRPWLRLELLSLRRRRCAALRACTGTELSSYLSAEASRAHLPYRRAQECWTDNRPDASGVVPHAGVDCSKEVINATLTWLKLGGRRIDNGDSYEDMHAIGEAMKAPASRARRYSS